MSHRFFAACQPPAPKVRQAFRILNGVSPPVILLAIDLIQRQVVDRIKNNISPPVLGLFDVAVEKVDGVPVNICGIV